MRRNKWRLEVTSYNIFDWFNSGSMCTSKTTTEDKDAAKEAEKEEMMIKIKLKREKDREKAARMVRLDTRRKE